MDELAATFLTECDTRASAARGRTPERIRWTWHRRRDSSVLDVEENPRARRRDVIDERELVVQSALQHVTGERVETHLRPTQILQNRDVPLHLPADAADIGDDGAVFLVCGVGEIETEAVDSGIDESSQHVRPTGRRPDRRDDFGTG